MILIYYLDPDLCALTLCFPFWFWHWHCVFLLIFDTDIVFSFLISHSFSFQVGICWFIKFLWNHLQFKSSLSDSVSESALSFLSQLVNSKNMSSRGHVSIIYNSLYLTNLYIQYWWWESFPCLTVSHKFPQETSCPDSSVVITHVWKFLWLYLGLQPCPMVITEMFRNGPYYHGTQCVPREFVGYRETRETFHRQYCMYNVVQ